MRAISLKGTIWQSDLGAEKKIRKRSSKRNRRVDDSQNQQKRETVGIKGMRLTIENQTFTDLDHVRHKLSSSVTEDGTQSADDNPQIRKSKSAKIYVCPVVSSSILLRHDDEEEDIDREVAKDRDQTEQVDKTNQSQDQTEQVHVDKTNQSFDSDARSTIAVDKSFDKKIKNEKTVIANVVSVLKEASTTTQKLTKQDEAVARVIHVQLANDSCNTGPLCIENKAEKYTETSVKSTHERIKHRERLPGTKTVFLSAEKSISDPVVPESGNRRRVFGPQSESSDKIGVYKSTQGIEDWIKQSNPGTSSPTRNDSRTLITAKKVSEFRVPWKPSKLPPKPLPLKKRSSHLYKIPDIARSESDDDTVNWIQVEPKGPQTEVLWTTKPSAFDVKLPPLPKRLLERKGSVEKLQESWILPQVKQIETLKREYGRFPGLVVPSDLRQHYSLDIKKDSEKDNDEGDTSPDTDADKTDEDCNMEADTTRKDGDN